SSYHVPRPTGSGVARMAFDVVRSRCGHKMGTAVRKCRLASKCRARIARIATVAQSALVDVVRGEDVSHGVTARELLELGGNRDAMSVSSLERWLLESG